MSIIPKPATYRIVVDKNFSFSLPGVPPSRFRCWLIWKLLGWDVEFTVPGEAVTAERKK